MMQSQHVFQFVFMGIFPSGKLMQQKTHIVKWEVLFGSLDPSALICCPNVKENVFFWSLPLFGDTSLWLSQTE